MVRIIAFVCLLILSVPAMAANWDSASQYKAILEEMEDPKNKIECNQKCQHKILNEHLIELSPASLRVVIAYTTSKENDCHACYVDLSFFVFEKKNDNWQRKSTHLNFTGWGSWGSVNTEDVYFKALSLQHYALFLKGGHTGQGYTGEILEMHLVRDGGFKKMLSYCTLASNAGAVEEGSPDLKEWEAKTKFIAQSGQLPQLQVSIFDSKKGLESTSLFAFDGKKYTSDNADPRLTGPCT